MSYSTNITLVASTTVTSSATTSGTAITGMDLYRRGTFILSVSAIASGSPTLDLAIQAYINGYWTDIARFAQMSTVSDRVLWDVGGTLGTGTTTIEEATQSLAITVSTKRAGPWGTQLRARYTVASAGSITFTCVGVVTS